MPRVLTAPARKVMDDLPPYFWDDPFTQAVLNAGANELARVDQAAHTIAQKAIPSRSDNDYRLLGIWEWIVGLPVEPVGRTIAERRTRVLAHLRGRGDGRGSTWQTRMNEVIGSSTSWTYVENSPGPGQIEITIPYSVGGVRTAWIESITRAITPANLEIVMRYDRGFVLDVSTLGDAL